MTELCLKYPHPNPQNLLPYRYDIKVGGLSWIIQVVPKCNQKFFTKGNRGRFDNRRGGDVMMGAEVGVMHVDDGKRGCKSRSTGGL